MGARTRPLGNFSDSSVRLKKCREETPKAVAVPLNDLHGHQALVDAHLGDAAAHDKGMQKTTANLAVAKQGFAALLLEMQDMVK